MVPRPLQRDEAITLACRQTDRAFSAGLERRLKGTGVSFMQYVGLGYVVAPEPTTLVDLAESLSISVPTCVRLIDRMERDGFLTRNADMSDARVKRLVPTAKGVELWNELGHLGPELLLEAYEGIDAEDLETAKRVLARVRQNLSR
jgi:MarR family transcriptional regulator for hemolysin